MDTNQHNFDTLFTQLGLQTDIDRFVTEHRPLAADLHIWQAPFWNQAQADFLRESIEGDSDWAEMVDELDRRLH